MADHADDIHQIFLEALERPRSEWASFLEARCADEAKRHEVLALLERASGATEFLDRPAIDTFSGLAGFAGSQFGDFRVVRELGRGGMGVVYLADDTRLGRRVALKVLHRSGDGAEEAARVLREARTAAKLSHPHIVNIYSAGEDEGTAYIVMEYVEGRTLREVIGPPAQPGVTAPPARERPDIRTVAGLARDIADALDHAHRNGVIHRDVKPSNILIDQSGVGKLADFGVARADQEQTIAGAAQIAGSLPYMSPEQARVRTTEVDHRSDIFSLGVVLYECLTGARPYEGPTPQETLKALSESDREAVKVRRTRADVPRDLEVICHKAIEKSPHHRYQTAAHFGADLRAFLAGDPILARPPGPGERLWRLVKRHRLAAALSVLSVTGLGVGLEIRELRRDSKAWLSVRSDGPPCVVTAQAMSRQTFEVSDRVIALGRTPIDSATLEAGPYRVTVVSTVDPSQFVEFNALLTTNGRRGALALRVKTAEMRGTPAPGSTAPAPGELVGYLMPGTSSDGMVRVEGGEYQATPAELGPDRPTLVPVKIAAFRIDRTEVSNRAYREFVVATGHRMPPPWRDGFEESLADRPVVGVSAEDAEAYARWLGKRLPTAIEWEAAACGAEGSPYPWGAAPVEGRASVLSAEERVAASSGSAIERFQAYGRHTVDVATPEPWGDAGRLLHAFDNVSELTGSVYLDSKGACWSVWKGRCWSDEVANLTLRSMWRGPIDSIPGEEVGFRCAKTERPASAPG